jgi:hypothetical protein
MELNLSWTNLKAFVNARSASLQWFFSNNVYYLYASDGLMCLSAQILTDGSDAADLADFIANYQSLAGTNGHPLNVFNSIQSGTWTVQPGNTANTTPWLMTVSTALPTGANTIGAISNSSFASTQSGTWTIQPGNTANTTPWLMTVSTALPTGSNTIGTVNPPTLTKGTQGSTGVSVQALKDAGRNQTNFFMAVQIVSTATDTLMSLTGYKGGVAVTATTTPAVVTSGKTYRIISITIDYTTIITTPGSVRFTLRANTSGTVVIGSPAVCTWEIGEPSGIAPVAGKKNTITIPIPDGMEFAAGTGIGISMVGLNTVGTAAAVGYGRITLNGFEY